MAVLQHGPEYGQLEICYLYKSSLTKTLFILSPLDWHVYGGPAARPWVRSVRDLLPL